MAFIPVPDTAEVRVEQTLHGEQVNNILHFARVGGWDGPSLSSLAALVFGQWGNNVMAPLSSALELQQVVARDISVQDGEQLISPAGPAVPGGVSGPALPGNVAFCITHRTGLVGRSRRGRSYVAGLPEAAVTGNALSSASANALETAFNAVRAATNAQGYFFCVVSRYTNGAPRPAGITTPVIGSVARDLTVDSQRGRLR